MNNSRDFSPRQRQEIYNKSGGKCQLCSTAISMNAFEADHITPWSLGGPTTVENGQALCRPCNQNKSAQMSVAYKHYLPQGFVIRNWQDDFINRCHEMRLLFL